ncbi:hypothetical protein [Acetobacter sp. P5B1]|uniref:hypothetical protein n=1 Tax=Acetobacter sp. P5B1 TaxID=2762620 RepID=UPI001C0544C7|nr:hypothetical protein [Acetobacter sp. P5B1]
MIKRLSLLAFVSVSSNAFGQSTAPVHPNHTLLQYSAIAAANNNAAAPRRMLRMTLPSAGGYSPLLPPGGISKNTLVPLLYADGSTGTLEQIGSMADSSVQQAGANQPLGYVQPDQYGNITNQVTGAVGAAKAAATGTTMQRTISDRAADHYNLADLGAKLDNSADDLQTIQTIYTALPDGAVVDVPRYSRWTGTILKPAPGKKITWNFLANIWNPYIAAAGDNDLTIQSGNVYKMSRHSQNAGSGSFMYPGSADFWNDNPNFAGVWAGNTQQYSAFMAHGMSSPVSRGNTGALSGHLESFGHNADNSYDTVLDLNAERWGNNSLWGLIIDSTDYSGLLPQAFSQWNESDTLSNGYDVAPWDDQYQANIPSHRVGFWFGARPTPKSAWTANSQVTNLTMAQGAIPKVNTIKVTVGGVDYVWYCYTSGKTGETQPAFPAPAEFNGTISGGVLTVKTLVQGALAVGMNITASGVNEDLTITSQLTGTRGGVGTYQVSDTKLTSAASGWYGANHVKDGTAVWAFGSLFNQTISGVIFATGDVQYGSVVGSDSTIYGAMIDASNAKITGNAAVLRMAANQKIDLSADKTVAGRNQHTLGYDSTQHALIYNVNGVPVVSIRDSGAILSSAPAQMPIMARAQILAYPSPVKGMEIYDSDDDAPAIYTGAAWKLMALSALPAN